MSEEMKALQSIANELGEIKDLLKEFVAIQYEPAKRFTSRVEFTSPDASPGPSESPASPSVSD